MSQGVARLPVPDGDVVNHSLPAFRHLQGEHFGAFLGQSGHLITPGRTGNPFPVGASVLGAQP
ncbi:hypothetical protein ACFFW8_03370 [Erwinia tracheiphila]